MNPYQPPAPELDVARPTDGVAPVEPFTSVGGLLKRAVAVYFGNLKTIAATTLVVFAPVHAVKAYLLHGSQLADNAVVAMRVEGLLESIFGSLVTAALLIALSHKLDTGRDLGLRGAYGAGVRRWGPVFGARFLSSLYVGFGLLLLVIPGLVWLVKYAVTDEVATLETGPTTRPVLKRSADLVAGHAWKIAGVGLVSGVGVLALQLAGGFASGLVDSWAAEALFDCVTDVGYRFFTVMMLLVYRGLALPTTGAGEAVDIPARNVI